MKAAFRWTSKAFAVWIALLAATVAAGIAIPLPEQGGGDGPLSAAQGFLAVNGLCALVLAAIAPRLTFGWRANALVLFALLYGAGSLLAHIEAYFFGSFLALPPGLLERLAAIDLFRCAAGAAAAALLWRREPAPAFAPAGLAWKLPAVGALYIFVYFAAGYVIAWQSAAIRDFYGAGFGIDLETLLLLQVARGLAWAALAWIAVRALQGSWRSIAVRVGAAFAVFMAAPLLYPSPVMPWAVRQVHLLEVGLSNFLFGFAAAALLAWRAAGARAAPAAGNRVAAAGSLP